MSRNDAVYITQRFARCLDAFRERIDEMQEDLDAQGIDPSKDLYNLHAPEKNREMARDWEAFKGLANFYEVEGPGDVSLEEAAELYDLTTEVFHRSLESTGFPEMKRTGMELATALRDCEIPEIVIDAIYELEPENALQKDQIQRMERAATEYDPHMLDVVRSLDSFGDDKKTEKAMSSFAPMIYTPDKIREQMKLPVSERLYVEDSANCPWTRYANDAKNGMGKDIGSPMSEIMRPISHMRYLLENELNSPAGTEGFVNDVKSLEGRREHAAMLTMFSTCPGLDPIERGMIAKEAADERKSTLSMAGELLHKTSQVYGENVQNIESRSTLNYMDKAFDQSYKTLKSMQGESSGDTKSKKNDTIDYTD